MWEGGITIAPPEGVWEAQLHPIPADDRLTITRPLILSMRDEGYDANGGIVIVFRQNATYSINETSLAWRWTRVLVKGWGWFTGWVGVAMDDKHARRRPRPTPVTPKRLNPARGQRRRWERDQRCCHRRKDERSMPQCAIPRRVAG